MGRHTHTYLARIKTSGGVLHQHQNLTNSITEISLSVTTAQKPRTNNTNTLLYRLAQKLTSGFRFIFMAWNCRATSSNACWVAGTPKLRDMYSCVCVCGRACVSLICVGGALAERERGSAV